MLPVNLGSLEPVGAKLTLLAGYLDTFVLVSMLYWCAGLNPGLQMNDRFLHEWRGLDSYEAFSEVLVDPCV